MIATSFFYRISIKLAGNEDRHQISDKFDFGPLSITHESYPPLRVTWTSENVLRTIAVSFLIESSSDLQVMRTGIKSWTSSISGQLWLFRVTCPLVSHRHIMGKMLSGRKRLQFLIGSSLNVQITRAGMESQTSSIVAQFLLFAWEIPALEGLIDFGKCCPDHHENIPI